MIDHAIEKHKNSQPPSVVDFIRTRSGEFTKVLPTHLNADRIMRLALSAIRTTPHLAECSLQSVAVSLMACSALGLEPNTPLQHAYLIPYRCNVAKRGEPKRYEWRCQLIVGYRGYIELFYRSGVVQSVQAWPVFEGDHFEYTLGLNPNLEHKPSNDPKRTSPDKLTHVYCVVRLKDTDLPVWAVMDRAQIEERRSFSQSKDWKTKEAVGPWKDHFVAMALKTIVRDITRWIPFSVEKAAAAEAFEYDIENGNTRAAVTALGPDAIDSSALLLAGIPEDVSQPDDDDVPDSPPTIDTVTAKNKEKTAEARETRKREPTATAQAQECEALRVTVIDQALKKWGDDGMLKLAQIMRELGTSISDAGIDALNSAIEKMNE